MIGIGIPSEYLAKMGAYSTKIEGVDVKVKVVDISCTSVIETHINEMRSALEKKRPRVVGVDTITFEHYGAIRKDSCESIVLYDGANFLIIYLPSSNFQITLKAPEELMKFLQDSSICFVGSTKRPSVLAPPTSWGVRAGTLAALVLKKPNLIHSRLEEISREVGVDYKGQSGSTIDNHSVTVHSICPFVLTDQHVKSAVTDAYVYYKIGHKLLSSL